MIRDIIFAFLIILFLENCNSQSNAEKDSFNYDKTFNYEIPESKIIFVLPDKYSKKTVEEYKELMNNSHLSDEIISNQINLLNSVKNNFPNFDLLIDTISFEGLIWIIRTGPQIELNKESAKLFVQSYSQNKQNNNLTHQIEEIVEKKLISKEFYKYIKLKIKQEYFEGERYFTHYLISTNENTLGISIVDKNGNDYQEFINRIKLLK
jgi:hypothetical protein